MPASVLADLRKMPGNDVCLCLGRVMI